MSAWNETPEGTNEDASGASVSPTRPALVLVVDDDGPTRRGVVDALADPSLICETASSIAEAVASLERDEFDAAIVPMRLRDGSGLDLVRLIASSGLSTKTIVISESPLVTDAVDAMRSGAVDMLASPIAEAELLTSVVGAVDKARRQRRQSEREDHLKALCKKLHSSQQKMADHVDSLCTDLVDAYEELATKSGQAMDDADPIGTGELEADDFSSSISSDLDIESLLRTSLEHMLSKTGPTNAAVFLPCNHCDFNLGAYVNYDCPKDTVDVLLDQLADLLAPKLQGIDGVVELSGEQEISEFLEEDAGWFTDYEVVAFACMSEGECLAVISFFREYGRGFSADLIDELKSMGDRPRGPTRSGRQDPPPAHARPRVVRLVRGRRGRRRRLGRLSLDRP